MTQVKSSKRAEDLFLSGLYCAESVLQASAEKQGIESPLVPGIASGFCSGMSRTNDICGALSGGIIALGMAMGRNSGHRSLDNIYGAVGLLKIRFESEFGSCNCFQLTGCDFRTDEGQERFVKQELHMKCCEFVGKSAFWVEQLVMENKGEE